MGLCGKNGRRRDKLRKCGNNSLRWGKNWEKSIELRGNGAKLKDFGQKLEEIW